MKLETVEDYWTAELGESVVIVPQGWDEYPSDYNLYVNGCPCYTAESLEKIERWLEVYSMVRESNEQ